MAPITQNNAQAPDGVRLHYAHMDGPTDARVLLVHSLAMDHTFWRPVMEELQGAASVIALDCRGHGASDKPQGPYAVEQFANDVAAVLDHAGWPEAVVAGASMGGCVALAVAAHLPKRCSGLGLFDTTAWYGPNAAAEWAERADKGLAQGLESLVGFQKTRWFSDAFRAEQVDVVDESVAVFLRNDPRAYADSCRMLGAVDLRASLPDIAIPTRIAVGEEDYATPVAMAQALYAGIRGSTLSIIQNGRHLTPLEHPRRIAGELKQLIEFKAS